MYKQIIIFFFFINSSIFANEEYFLTLRNEKVNLRQGPSFEHPVKIFYKKKYLPVLIQDKSGNFRKIRDHENNSGWIHISQLSKKKAAINIENNLFVFKNPTIYSKPLVILNKGRLCIIRKCKNEWCKIKVDKYNGWVKMDALWGKL
jgi:SH3-like domain-containing protein